MKLRFFFVDPNNHVQQASQGRVLAAWKRRKPWDESTGTRDLRLITVVIDHLLRQRRQTRQLPFHVRVVHGDDMLDELPQRGLCPVDG